MGFKVLLRTNCEQFAEELGNVFEEQPYGLIAPNDIDWEDDNTVRTHLNNWSPSIFINFSIPEHSDSVNVNKEIQSLSNICSQCRDMRIPLLHFSSYRVFGKTVPDGEINEDVTPKPRDDYGKALLRLEHIAGQTEKNMILRVSWLFDIGASSLLNTIVPKLISRRSFFVSDHDFGTPLTRRFLCHLLLAKVQQILCGANNWGVFHIRSSDSCSEAELCDSLVRLLSSITERELDLPLVAGKGDDRRILSGNALLSGRRVTDNFGIQLQSWRKGLKAMLRNYLEKTEHLLK